MNAPFLTARWLNLAMINYEVDPVALASRVPAGTELDDWNGKTYLSMVGFQFFDTRVLGMRIPFHIDFEEVNLRFYVRRRVDHELRRGVVFVKELVPRAAIAAVARWAYNENYVALPMQHEVRPPSSGASGGVRYAWKHGGQWEHLSVQTAGEPFLPEPGSDAQFITEHYWGYARQADGSTVEYKVEHPPWTVWRGTSSDFDCDAASLYGPELAPFLVQPASAFVAVGSETTVFRGVPLPSLGSSMPVRDA